MKRLRILFAASDRDLLMCYGKLLTLYGYDVTTAFDGVQVRNRAETGDYDIAVIDDNMPRIDSGVLAEKVSANGIPVIMMCGNKAHGTNGGNHASVSAYISYPFLPAELSGVISEVCGKSGNAPLAGEISAQAGSIMPEPHIQAGETQ